MAKSSATARAEEIWLNTLATLLVTTFKTSIVRLEDHIIR